MVITVKERTHEIGIRKALGATPATIVVQILSEAVLITGVAGFFGMSIGVFLLDFAARHLPVSDFFTNPEVDLWIMLSTTLSRVTDMLYEKDRIHYSSRRKLLHSNSSTVQRYWLTPGPFRR